MARWIMKDRLLKMVEAYNKRKLGCFTQPNAWEKNGCVYDYGDGSHCIVGSALTEYELKRVHSLNMNEETGVNELAGANMDYSEHAIINVGDRVRRDLNSLQTYHDEYDPAYLGEQLQLMCKKYGVTKRVRIPRKAA